MTYVICDLDGCISDDRWRREWLPQNNKSRNGSYDRYHTRCLNDPVVPHALDLFRYSMKEDSAAIFVTGRPDRLDFKAKTECWLHVNIKLESYILLMRPGNSYAPAPNLKMKLLNDFFEGLYGHPGIGWSKVYAALDDRMDILSMYPIRQQDKLLVEADR